VSRSLAVAGLVLTLSFSCLIGTANTCTADTSERVVRVGFVYPGSRSSAQRYVPALWRRLRELGWIEGRNLVIEERWADGNLERLPALMSELVEGRVDVLVTNGTPATLAALANQYRLATMYGLLEFVEAGGLLSYGPNMALSFRRAAEYVDKILRGASPGDLPIEQAKDFSLAVNLKTAKTLGLTIPDSILLRADEVIR